MMIAMFLVFQTINLKNVCRLYCSYDDDCIATSKPSFALIKMKRTTFLQTKELFKKERYLNLHNFNNRNAITKRRLSSHNFAINPFKWYNLQKVMNIYKNCEKKEIEDEIRIIFSCNEYDNIRRKALSKIQEEDKIKLQIGNKAEKLKLFFAKGSLKALNVFGHFLMRAFESR